LPFRQPLVLPPLPFGILLIHWKRGEAWFWKYLADADPAVNVASWQWVAGSGADAAPYFRIFNPEIQSKKFDADGDYIRKWVPELENLPSNYIHAPINAPESELRDAGVILGKTYPLPIVEHSKMREKALAIYQNL
jgi:deoxyribodipyrimidine photo-lyase